MDLFLYSMNNEIEFSYIFLNNGKSYLKKDVLICSKMGSIDRSLRYITHGKYQRVYLPALSLFFVYRLYYLSTGNGKI